MTYQGAINELKSLENNGSMPDWFKPALKKVRETMEMDRRETLDNEENENEFTKPFDLAQAVIQACPDKEWLEEVIFFLVSYSKTLDILDNEEEESEE